MEKKWRLKELRIRLMTYGPLEGKHQGSVTFTNEGEALENDEFTLKLNEHRCKDYMKVIKDDLARSTTELCEQFNKVIKDGE